MEKKVKFHYQGSIFWLIFWIILFFPFALILLLTNGSFVSHGESRSFRYDGSPFWLYFWVIFFFPITFLLLFLNGFFLVTKKKHASGS